MGNCARGLRRHSGFAAGVALCGQAAAYGDRHASLCVLQAHHGGVCVVQTIPCGPRSAEGQAPDLLFRQVPGDMALRMEMDRGFDDWTLEFYNCFSGNFVTSLHYRRTEKVTWKGLHLALRHNLLDKDLITGGMSFKVFYENSEPTSLQALVFKPYKFDEVEGPQADATPKAKPKNTPQAKSVVKRPAVAKSVLKRPGRK